MSVVLKNRQPIGSVAQLPEEETVHIDRKVHCVGAHPL